jgi:hypothetical protein
LNDYLDKLAEAMDWVIPADSSPGASAGLAQMVRFVEAQGFTDLYKKNLSGLHESDLSDASNAFAQLFIDHVRDVYYTYPQTGSWADIGFKVTGA